MKWILIVFSSLIIVTQSIHCQLSTIPLFADYATFKGSQNFSYVEIYLSFYQNNLSYQNEEDSLLVAHFSHTIEIFQNDSLIQQDTRKYKNSVSINDSVTKNLPFIDVFAYSFTPGLYKINTIVFDDVGKKMGKQSLEVNIPAYDSTFTLSDIQLSTRIEKTDKKSNYSLKNNITIYPKPSRIFDIFNPLLYFYFEAYNLKIGENNQNKYSYHYYITNKDGEVLIDYPVSRRSSALPTIAEVKGMNIVTLKSDAYYINIDLIDSLSGNKISASKMFCFKKGSIAQAEADSASQEISINEYQDYTKEELKDEFEKLKYIVTSSEKKIFKQLDENGMRKFLIKFWQERDPDPSTPINEYKREYFEILQIATQKFSNSFRKGWETDRGRVLLVYGKPDEIERFPNTLGAKPYEIWYYYSLEGGCEFIFADISSFGDYLLLHSTHRNEIKDYNWRERIVEAGSVEDY
jgi:GWxTD domain-containing protein